MWELGNFDPEIAKKFIDFIIVNTKASKKEDKIAILNAVAGRQTDKNADAVKDSPAYDKFNYRLRSTAAGPVLRAAALRDDADKITTVRSSCPGLKFNALRLRGVSGESPLHLAAAMGFTSFMAELLQAQADADVQDAQGETPLHYATLAGHADAVNLLLASGADADIESFYRETPYDVAAQNPAYFIGINQAAVLNALAAVS